jgi:hypothetical protein
MQKHLAELLDWYRGEVAGEAFFCALADSAAEEGRAVKWRKLAQLERHVADRLRVVLEASAIPMPSATTDRHRGLKSAQEYSGLTWPETLNRLRSELVGYVRDFEEAEARMPEEVIPLARFVTDHERALLSFVLLELQADGRNSLDQVRSLLGETRNSDAGQGPASS